MDISFRGVSRLYFGTKVLVGVGSILGRPPLVVIAKAGKSLFPHMHYCG